MRLLTRTLAATCLGLLLFAGACMFPDDRPRISIEYGTVPELEGAEVLIDGKVVGKLEMTGQATRVSFPVEKGPHEVCIHDRRFDCEPAKIRAELPSQKIRLMVTVGEQMSLSPSARPVISFMY